MYPRSLRICLLIALAASLAGCWNATRQYNKFMALGRRRDVPVLIYNTSWNGANGVVPGVLGIAFVTTGDDPITAVALDLGACSFMGDFSYTFKVNLNGPFLPGRSYVISHPELNSFGDARRFVVRKIGITGVGGKEVMYRKNVGQFLAPHLTNYCRLKEVGN